MYSGDRGHCIIKVKTCELQIVDDRTINNYYNWFKWPFDRLSFMEKNTEATP